MKSRVRHDLHFFTRFAVQRNIGLFQIRVWVVRSGEKSDVRNLLSKNAHLEWAQNKCVIQDDLRKLS